MTERKMLCFDMDGTIANLYSVPDWLPKLRAEDVSPYREAAPMWDMQQLAKTLHNLIAKGWEIAVITWLAKGNTPPSYDAAVRKEKKEWLDRYAFPYQHLHMVKYGTTKADCVRHKATTAILIDDNAKVRKGWHLGATINPKTCNLIEELEKL